MSEKNKKDQKATQTPATPATPATATPATPATATPATATPAMSQAELDAAIAASQAQLAALTAARAESAKRAESARVESLIGQIKDLCVKSGYIGRLTLDVKQDGSISYEIPSKGSKGSRGGNGGKTKKDSISAWIRTILDLQPADVAQKEVRALLIGADPVKAASVNDGHVKGALRNFRISRGYPTTRE